MTPPRQRPSRDHPVVPLETALFHLSSYVYIWLTDWFLAVLGPCCRVRAFSSCGEQGLLPTVVAASLVAEHRFRCSAARGILPAQGSNLCPLHWRVDSYPLHHRGSPFTYLCRDGSNYSLQILFEKPPAEKIEINKYNFSAQQRGLGSSWNHRPRLKMASHWCQRWHTCFPVEQKTFSKDMWS